MVTLPYPLCPPFRLRHEQSHSRGEGSALLREIVGVSSATDMVGHGRRRTRLVHLLHLLLPLHQPPLHPLLPLPHLCYLLLPPLSLLLSPLLRRLHLASWPAAPPPSSPSSASSAHQNCHRPFAVETVFPNLTTAAAVAVAVAVYCGLLVRRPDEGDVAEDVAK